MRIVIHDFSGHPFQVQLSRELSRRGHSVFHLYCDDIVGAKGSLFRRGEDADSLVIKGISIGSPINRYNFIRRFYDERKYGKLLSKFIKEIKPDLVISSNTPLDAQLSLFSHCREREIKFIFWLQDILGLASKSVLSKKLGALGALIGNYYIFRERQLLRKSNHVIPISNDFLTTLDRWKVPRDNITVIHNWAPLPELPQMLRNNPWTHEHNLAGKRVALYSGALGLKHNPKLLWHLAGEFSRMGPEYKLVVISEGLGADWLLEQWGREPLQSLLLLPFQPFERLPEVLAAADVLLAVLEPDAGEFCVPSKVLSYMCVGRPVVLAADAKNLASRLVSESACGLVVNPNDTAAFTDSVVNLLRREDKSQVMGQNARFHAEAHFNIDTIGNAFEHVIEKVIR